MSELNVLIDGVRYVPATSPEDDIPPERVFNAAAFFDYVRHDPFSGMLLQTQVDGMNLIARACAEAGLVPLIPSAAYIFATVFHETAQTMQPIEEYGGPSTRYAPWYGRGHVQLTWEDNYKKQQSKHGHRGVEFCVHDDWNRALIPHVSAVICVGGMRDGDFTGKKLGDYINATQVDYWNARRVVNGTDRAELIAGYARSFETGIRLGFGEPVEA